MAKMKLNAGSLKTFFTNHVEKIVLGMVLLLLVLFVWAGTRLEGTEQTPVQLDQQVARANEHVDQNTWENVAAKEDYQPATDHLTVAAKATEATLDTAYATNIPLGGGASKHVKRRSDPVLMPPIEPEVQVVTAALARLRKEEEPDAFADLKNTEQKKVEVAKPKKKKKKRGGYGDYGSEMMMMGDVGPGYGMGGEEGGMADMYSSMMSGMPGMPGMMSGATGAGSPGVRADAKKFPGFRPTAGAAMLPTGGSSVIGRTIHVVAVKALVPWRQQWDEYQRVFKEADGYYPNRDMPRYLSFRAQRAEVPSDPSAPLTWQYIWWTEKVREKTPTFGFAAYPGELADPKYVHPELTMPAPPLMMVDYPPLVLHSKVPMQEAQKMVQPQEVKPLVVENPEEAASAESSEELPDAPGTRRPGMGGGMPGSYGMEMPGMGGGMAGYPGMGGGYGREGGDDYGGAGMYGAMMAGMPGMGMGGMPGMTPGPQVEFLLVRFFDYIPAGKKYVYRIQLVMEDPNHPQNPQVAPADRTLDKTAQERLSAVTAEEEAKKTRVYYRTTEWSEPTPAAYVEPRRFTFAGAATAPRTFDIPYGSGPAAGQRTGYTLPAEDELRGEIMTTVFDPGYAVDVPAVKQVARGTFLNFTQNADVIEPVNLVYKVLENYDFKTYQLVADLRGGEPLPVAKPKVDATVPGTPASMASPTMMGMASPMQPADEEAEPEKLNAPAEYALIDATGRLVVRNELDDWESFDMLAPPPPIQVQAAATASEDAYSEEMSGAGYGGTER